MAARNLIVCSDGTWNTADNRDNGKLATTNVYDFHEAVLGGDPGDPNQLKYYRQGVGSSGNALKRALGGAIGYGISKDIKAPYQWLCETYRPGDRIFLIGFSRGSYTVRSLAGLIAVSGLYDLPEDKSMSKREKSKIVTKAYDTYRKHENLYRIPSSVKNFEDVGIHFIGVFDTVGALGIPANFRFLRMFQNREWYTFHDTKLTDKVKTARHAVAMDERRATFTPTFWTDVKEDRDVEQIWFAGVHADVGGGYHNHDLGNVSMDWIMTEAEKAGIKFLPSRRAAVVPEPLGKLHNSVDGFFKKMSTRPRSVPELDTAKNVHASVKTRREAFAQYWPSKRLGKGEKHEITIDARNPWVATGLFLGKDETYNFEAQGQWFDASIKSGPDGVQTSEHGLAYKASDLWSGLTGMLFKREENEPSTGMTARRHPDWPWFALIGAIANGKGTDEVTTRPVPHQSLCIGTSTHGFSPSQSGYLYCYANDLWLMYGNNSGELTLTVTRTS